MIRELFTQTGKHTLKNGTQENVTYTVTIDWDLVGKLALQAMRNRSGKSKAGPLRVKVINRETRTVANNTITGGSAL